jgi:hypothetical protein
VLETGSQTRSRRTDFSQIDKTGDIQKVQPAITVMARRLDPKRSKRDKVELNSHTNLIAKADDFNPIQSFFWESLPSKNVKFYSKAGWVPTLTRAEVCLVKILDRNKSYVLAVFAEDPAFDKDKIIFPEISKLVYNEMKYTIVK